MCLQDIKIAKSKEIRGTRPGVSGQTVISMKLAPNRVYVRFGLMAQFDTQVNAGIEVFWIPDNTPIQIGILNQPNPYIELWLERHGELVYGPFSFEDTSSIFANIGAVELLQNTNPEDALK